jgi:methylated-DNA-[protein]-cysteine S-methyltransferase
MRTHTIIESPVGHLTLTGEDGHLTGLFMDTGRGDPAAGVPRDDAPFAAARDLLDRYFAGEQVDFTELALRPRGSEFQKRVWRTLQDIPYGETISYGRQAERVGVPGRARAVGRANGSNPLPIVIPCHRVIGADGSLTGYGGGLERKRLLLELEAGVPSLPGVA